MIRTLRQIIARTLLGAALVAPHALPAAAAAETAPPAAEKLSGRELHHRLARSSGWIQQRDAKGEILAHGTGWVLDAGKKLMVTNDHVVTGQDVVWVIFPQWQDGKVVREEAAYAAAKAYRAEVIDRDRVRDLALLKLEALPAGTTAVPLADAEPEEGDEVRLIGGFTAGGDGLVWGLVRGEVRTVGPQEAWPGGPKVRKVLSDAGTNGGNSGSAVLDAAGRLVGVHAAVKLNARNISVHVSVVELKAYAAAAVPLADPKTAAAFLTRGQRRLDAGRTDAALADADAALAKNPKLAGAYHVRGQARVAKKDAKAAAADLAEAVRLDPTVFAYRISHGLALRQVGKSEEARAEFTAAAGLNPEDPTAYNQRGLTAFFAGKFAAAEEDFTFAINKDMKDAVLWGNRADARSRQGKFDDAVEDAREAAKLAPRTAYYWQLLGRIRAKAGQHREAVDDFTRAIDLTGGKDGTLFAERAKAKRAAGLDAGDDVAAAAKLGVKVEDGSAAVVAAKPVAKAGEPVVAKVSPFVGMWKMVTTVNGVKLGQVIELRADGTFEAGAVFQTAGGTRTVTDTGTWSVADGRLTVTGKQTGTVLRRYAAGKDGTTIRIEMTEIGQWVTFTRVN